MPNTSNIQNLKFLTLQHFCVPNGLTAVKTGSTMARAPVFSHNKGNGTRFTKLLFRRFPLHHGASFYPLLVSFCLQITYRKVRNLRIGVNKLVGKVLINLLCHAKFITSRKVSCLCNQHNYPCAF